MEKIILKTTLSPALQAKLEEMQQLTKVEGDELKLSEKIKGTQNKSLTALKETIKGNQPKDWKGHLEKVRQMQLWH